MSFVILYQIITTSPVYIGQYSCIIYPTGGTGTGGSDGHCHYFKCTKSSEPVCKKKIVRWFVHPNLSVFGAELTVEHQVKHHVHQFTTDSSKWNTWRMTWNLLDNNCSLPSPRVMVISQGMGSKSDFISTELDAARFLTSALLWSTGWISYAPGTCTASCSACWEGMEMHKDGSEPLIQQA